MQACSTAAGISDHVLSTPARAKAFGPQLNGNGSCSIWSEAFLCADEADVPNEATSDDSFTTDDEDTAAVSGKQMWTMSFEWQDESVADATEASTSFEESANFGQLPGSSHPILTSSSTDSKLEAAEPSPTDPDRDWIQPWSASPASTAPGGSKEQSQSYHSSKENQPNPKVEPMSDEHKTAILGKRNLSVSAAWYLPACL